MEAGAFIVSFILIVIICAISYIPYKIKLGRIYEIFNTMKVVPGYPIIGHVINFIGTPTRKTYLLLIFNEKPMQTGILYPYGILEVFRLLVDFTNEYGPNFAFWIAYYPVIVIGKLDDLKIAMQSQSCIGKGSVYYYMKVAVGDGLFSAPVHKWRNSRKAIQPTFNSRILDSFMPIFIKTSSICVSDVLSSYVNVKDVNWFRIFANTHLDSISQTAMGINIEAQRQNHSFAYHLERGMRAVFIRMTNIILHPNIIFKYTKLHAELKEALRHANKLTAEVLKEKKRKLKLNLTNQCNIIAETEPAVIQRKAFLDMLLEISQQGTKFSDKQLKDEVLTLFIGGTDSSAVTTCFFLSMMGMHQDIQKEVYEEIITLLGNEKEPDLHILSKLPLLERCLKETLRIFPPAPFIVRKVQEEEVELSDSILPVGVAVIFPIFYVHRCSDFWKDPLKFDPDRFLPENIAKQHPYAFIPFSGGLRNCIGIRYSYLNLKILLSMILRRYKVFCDYKSIEEIELKNCIVLKPKHGFRFHLEERIKN